MITSVGAVILNEALPEELRRDQFELDKKGTHALLRTIAEKHPDSYAKVVKAMHDVGREAAYTEGVSVSLSGIRRPKAKEALVQEMRQKIDAIRDDDALTDKQRQDAIVNLLIPYASKMQDAVYDESKTEPNNPFYLQVVSGARGKKAELSSLRGADLLVQDQRGQFIPVPILKSYGEGFSPADYFAASYGQRAGQISTKMAVADSGYGTKTLVNAAHRLVVTKDKPDPTRLPVGLPTSTDDKELVGQVLAHDTGKYKAGTIVTKAIQDDLQDEGVDEVLVHSPMTEITADGGISRWSGGRRHRPGLVNIGDNVGIAAAQAIGERWSQGMLNCLAAGTMVRMADFTTKRIEDIQVGDLVLGADKAANTFPVKVTNVYDHGVKPVCRFAFRKYASRSEYISLVSTTEHKVLTHYYSSSTKGELRDERMLPVGKINKNSGIVLAGASSHGPQLPDEYRAMLLGTLLGDGCYSPKVSGVNLSCADKTQIDSLNEYLAPLGLSFVLRSGQTIYYALRHADDGSEIVGRDSLGRVTDVRSTGVARNWLLELGVDRKYAHEKTIPACAMQWSNSSVAALLAGLFVTDGCVHFRKKDGLLITYGSTSQVMRDQVRELLRVRFGIYSTVTCCRGDKSRKRPMYYLQISKLRDVESFAKYIPLFGVKKQRLADYLARTGKFKTWQERANLAQKADAGLQPVYDIEVDHPDHLFVLENGMIVSNSKHSAGVKDKVSRSGVEYIFRLLGGPENFPEAGPLADIDGHVEDVRKADQGGHYIKVSGKEYYAPPGVTPKVEKGDRVEAGDDLTDGIPHPAQLVKLRGLGEARRVYANALHEAFNESGVEVNKRNVQAVTAGLLNWARVTNPDGIGDNVVDDIAPFNRLVASYKPRTTARQLPPKQAVGKYLEEPVLHYTPGTRINSKVLKHLEKYGVKDVYTHDDAPDFEPEFVRAVQSVYHDPDWQTRLAGFYTASAFQKAVHRGAVSDSNSTSYFPALAKGTGFGKNLKTTGTYGAFDNFATPQSA